MSNVAAKQDDVTNAADRLIKKLLHQAEDSEDLDFQLQVAQAATRYLAVKGRANIPEEGNSFDGWRNRINDGGGAAAPASSPTPGTDGAASASAPSAVRKASPTPFSSFTGPALDVGTISGALKTYRSGAK